LTQVNAVSEEYAAATGGNHIPHVSKAGVNVRFVLSRSDLGRLAGNCRTPGEGPSRLPTTTPTAAYGWRGDGRLMAGCWPTRSYLGCRPNAVVQFSPKKTFNARKVAVAQGSLRRSCLRLGTCYGCPPRSRRCMSA